MIIHEEGYVYNFNFHLVFVTKYRRKIFDTQEKVNTMKAILQRQATISKVTVSQLEVMPDHVHMLISFKPKYAPSNIVKNLKGASARIWFKQYPETKQLLWGGHLWSPSYYMGTLGDMSKEVVEKYIESQYTEAMRRQLKGYYGKNR